MEETQEQVVIQMKDSTYNKEQYEANQDYILKYRKIDPFLIFFAGNIFGGIFGSFSFWQEFWFPDNRNREKVRNKYVRNT